MSEGSSEKTRTMSLDLESHKDPRWSRRHPPTRVMLVWLESFEDHLHFPVGQYSLQQLSLTVNNSSEFEITFQVLLYQTHDLQNLLRSTRYTKTQGSFVAYLLSNQEFLD